MRALKIALKTISSSYPARFPIRFLSFMVLISTVIFCGFMMLTWRFYHEGVSFEQRSLRIKELEGKIIHLDEVLTMSARMAAATGDLKWEERYRLYEPALTESIQKAVSLSFAIKEERDAARSTENAHVYLVEMERASFDLVKQGRREEAWALLAGPEYENLKKIYADETAYLTSRLGERIMRDIEAGRRQMVLATVASLIVGVFWFMGWLSLLKVLRLWRANLSRTNQKLAQLSLAAQTSVLDLIQKNSDAIVILDEQGKVILMNASAESMFGHRNEEMSGKDFGFSLLSDEAMEIQILRSKGKAIFGDMKMSRLDWKGRPAYMALIRDITEKKNLQAQLFQAQKMEAIGQLAGGVAHDFNNLLTVINGFSEVLLQKISVEDSSYEPVQEIYGAGQRASALTSQLLAFSRRQIISPQNLNLNTLLRNAEKMLRRLIGEDIELVIILGEDLGTVKVDPSQFDQVILNLVVNARDALAKSGKITIETKNIILDQEYARHHSYITPGHYVQIAVSDTGCGIAPENRTHIFEPFFTTKEQGKGTGLGLATCYGIVKQNGGSIEVYSEPGMGAIFKIYFPRTDEIADIFSKETEKEMERGGTETVLLVEDEESVRNFAKAVLTQKGYRVLATDNGENALQLIVDDGGKEPHLLLTDVVMPKMSGRDLFESLKKIFPEIKVLFVSGYTEEVIIRHEVEKRNANFLQKPFTVQNLLKKVREALDK